MLTKELLRFRVRSGRLKPTFLPPADPAYLALAGDMASLLADSTGMRVGELDDALQALSQDPVAGGFRKLLLDGVDADDDDGTIETRRWAAFAASQALRTGGTMRSPAAFREAFKEIREELYADLPACRKVTSVREWTPEALVHRYNIALVQGLLLRARCVTISVAGELAERREFFRQLRFHRLMGNVKGGKGRIEVELSGPLSLFDQASTYGMRLANFFPHVTNLSAWELAAEVHIKNKTLELRLDQSAQLHSHYKKRTPYIPAELLAFVEAFHARTKAWKVAPAADFVHIGHESYCFPDLAITGQDGRVVHVELFHRWHGAQLKHRLQALELNPVSGLLLGVSKNLVKNAETGELVAASGWFAKHGFEFSEFPTPKALLSALASYGNV